MLPGLVRQVIYPLHEKLLYRPTFSYLDELEQTQWLSREELINYQSSKFTALLRSAYAHSPWHKKRIDVAEIDLRTDNLSVEDIKLLPTMTKADAKENRDQIAWQQVPGGLSKYNTGGSSGEPLVFYFGRYRQASDAAGRMRARRWWGVDVGDREVYLWGAPVELNKTDLVKTIRDRLFNQLVLNAFEMSTDNMTSYCEKIKKFNPKCIYGYASSIALLAAHARDCNIDIKCRNLEVVCTTGEPLYPDQRELIHEVFEAPVANEFGSRDIGFTAHESPDNQMLLMSESIILEVLDQDNQPVAPGQVGEAVMTGLCSEGQPFIRYRTGDMIRYTDELDKSGRSLHVIGEVIGRKTDFIVKQDGTIMHALSVIYVLREFEEVREFKIIQHSLNEMEVVVVANDKWMSGSSDKIVQGLKNRMGESVNINVKMVAEIPVAASGKHRYVESHVPLPSGQIQEAS